MEYAKIICTASSDLKFYKTAINPLIMNKHTPASKSYRTNPNIIQLHLSQLTVSVVVTDTALSVTTTDNVKQNYLYIYFKSHLFRTLREVLNLEFCQQI